MSTVTIACNAPSGIVLGTDAWNDPILLAGPPRAPLNTGFSPGYGLTDVDSYLSASWSTGPGADIVAAGAVWEVG